MPTIEQLLENNAAWAVQMENAQPGFFDRLSSRQKPEFLWIGCSDSRVPANEIIGLLPGDIFVHRNIANVVVQTDFNLLSVLQYAVDLLGVRHIIVCGHYGCGGIRAACHNKRLGLVDNWLRHIRDIARRRAAELDGFTGDAYENRLCELNVLAQTENLARTTIVEDAWSRGQPLMLHSWIYDLANGRIQTLSPALDGQRREHGPQNQRI